MEGVQQNLMEQVRVLLLHQELLHLHWRPSKPMQDIENTFLTVVRDDVIVAFRNMFQEILVKVVVKTKLAVSLN